MRFIHLLILLIPSLLFSNEFFNASSGDSRVDITTNKLNEFIRLKKSEDAAISLKSHHYEKIDKLIIEFPSAGEAIIDLVERVVNYHDEYTDMYSDCIFEVGKTQFPLISIEDCVWRKDKILLYKHKLDSIYDSSYNRYQSLFNNAKSYTTLMLDGSDYLDAFMTQVTSIVLDSLDLQVMLIIEIAHKEIGEAIGEPSLPIESDEPGIKGSGSGFYVNKNGNIVTNYHVVENCDQVLLDKENLDIIATDPSNDLAILRSYKENNNFIYFREGQIKKGEDILVVGYPFGRDLGDQSKITKGIVSSLQGIGNDFSRIQIDAAIQPGNSGGPALDINGNLLGVTVSSASVSAFIEIYETIPQNMNFAIKNNVLKMMLESNDIEFFSRSSNSVKTTNEIIKEADPATVFLQCYMS